MTASALLVLPIKAFDSAKGRLASTLTPDKRVRLAQECASRVVGAAGECDVLVVTSAEADSPAPNHDVATWAAANNASCIAQTSPGLNAAVREGVVWAAGHDYAVVVVAHSDIPLATPVIEFIDRDIVVIVPDTQRDGTNLMSLPVSVAQEFDFHYGPGSFRAHVAEARLRGHEPRVVASREWSLDLDNPEDLDDPRIREVLTWLNT